MTYYLAPASDGYTSTLCAHCGCDVGTDTQPCCEAWFEPNEAATTDITPLPPREGSHHMGIINDEIKYHVKNSLAVMDVHKLTVLGYSRLFQLAPEMRAKFPASMEGQERKLSTVLALFGGDLLEDEGALVRVLTELGRAHQLNYNTNTLEYQAVVEAFTWAIGQVLPIELPWFPVVDSWNRLLTLAADVMSNAFPKASVPPGPAVGA